MSKANPIHLSEEERNALRKIANSRTEEARRVQRANILLLSSEKVTQTKIAETVGLSRPSVILCLKKYLEAGWEYALSDSSRPGRPAIISDETNMWVRNIACQKPGNFGYPQELWTISKLQKHIQKTCEEAGHPELKDVAKSKVWSILNSAEIKPHRIRYYLERRDPEFESKMHDVLLVYKQVELMFDANGNIVWPDGERKTVTLSYDEKPGIQAIANVADDLLPTQTHGFIARDSEYKRLGTVSLLAGIDLLTGKIIPRISDTHKSADFVAFLKVLDKEYDQSDKIRIILDNHSIRTSKETRQYLATVPDRFEFVFTPTHGSWLNLIESFFGKLARVCLRGIRVKSKEELIERIYRYIDEVNDDPIVYHWTYKMDEVNVS
ncbi:IS630-like element ISMsm5 family transposase [Bacillota bacterium]